MTVPSQSLGRLSSRPEGWRSSTWPGGAWQSAHRPFTPRVSGEILSERHLVMVTLRGGAARHDFVNADGCRYSGPDVTGSVSFLPAGCARRLELRDVEWRWAAVALEDTDEGGPVASLARSPSVVLPREPLVFSLIEELDRVDAMEGGVEPAYGETLAATLASYLARRVGQWRAPDGAAHGLAPFMLRRVKDHVEERLADPLSIAELAALCGLSQRHFARSFKATVGQTPLAYIIRRRIERAKLLLAAGAPSIAAVALDVGFVHTGRFAHAFAAHTGLTPSAYRRSAAVR